MHSKQQANKLCGQSCPQEVVLITESALMALLM
jgi:hypothetical protein